MSKSRNIKINGEKLRKLILKNGGILSAVSKELGFANNYFSHACNRNLLSGPAMKLLCAKYGISEDYLAEKDEEPQKETPVADTQLLNIESLLCAVLAELKVMNKDRDLFAAMLAELKKFNG